MRVLQLSKYCVLYLQGRFLIIIRRRNVNELSKFCNDYDYIIIIIIIICSSVTALFTTLKTAMKKLCIFHKPAVLFLPWRCERNIFGYRTLRSPCYFRCLL
jgi:hypothetical protein